MKRLILLLLACCSMTVSSFAQALNIVPSSPPPGRYSGTPNPFFTSLDTVTNTGTDTLPAKIAGQYNSITFETDVNNISGTPYGTVVLLQANAQPGFGTKWKTLYTDSVKNSNNDPIIHVITGNPYTNYRQLILGAGTQQTSYQSQVLLR